MSVQDVKKWLCHYRDLDDELAHLSEELDLLEARSTSPRSSKLDGLPRAPGTQIDPIGSQVAQIEALKAEIGAIVEKMTVLRHEILGALTDIEGPRAADLRAVIRFRYLVVLDWPDVNDAMFGNRADFLDKEPSYQRRVYYLHRTALEQLSAILTRKD